MGGSHLILNRCRAAECHTIFPFVLNTGNRRNAQDHLRGVQIPDVLPAAVLNRDSELSMAAGEFIEVYKDQIGEWDGVATAFFIDTAKNIFLYIRTIAQIIATGGVWVNLGPLLYHYADVENEVSVELSWEEVKPAIAEYFDFVEVKEHLSQYAANMTCLTGVRYRCVFFVAKRNAVAAVGSSNPVFGPRD